jgi:Mn-dependent DtxR family transcriptional regulator
MSRPERSLVFSGKSGAEISTRVKVVRILHEQGGAAKLQHLATILEREPSRVRVHVQFIEDSGLLWTHQEASNLIVALRRGVLPPLGPEASLAWAKVWEIWTDAKMQAAVPQRDLETALGWTSRDTLRKLRALERQGYVEMRQRGRLTFSIAPTLKALANHLPTPAEQPLSVRGVFGAAPTTAPMAAFVLGGLEG